MKMLERECQVCGAKWRYYTDSSEEEDKIKASSQPCGHQGLSTFTEVELVVNKKCTTCWGRGYMRIVEGHNRKIVPCRCLRRKKDDT